MMWIFIFLLKSIPIFQKLFSIQFQVYINIENAWSENQEIKDEKK